MFDNLVLAICEKVAWGSFTDAKADLYELRIGGVCADNLEEVQRTGDNQYCRRPGSGSHCSVTSTTCD